MVERLLAGARYRPRRLLGTPTALAALRPWLARLDPTVEILQGSAALLAAVAGYRFHRGCLALAERGQEVDPALLTGIPGARTLVVLDGPADPANVGAAFRNSLAFGVDGVLLSAEATDPLYRKAIRASAGATLMLPFARWGRREDALGQLRSAGYTLLGLTPGCLATDITRVDPGALPSRLAILIGTEATGLSAEAIAAAHELVRIPMAPGVDSLNLATALGIALHRLQGPRLARGR